MSMFKPFEYQHGMVDHLRDTPHAALFAGMGFNEAKKIIDENYENR